MIWGVISVSLSSLRQKQERTHAGFNQINNRMIYCQRFIKHLFSVCSRGSPMHSIVLLITHHLFISGALSSVQHWTCTSDYALCWHDWVVSVVKSEWYALWYKTYCRTLTKSSVHTNSWWPWFADNCKHARVHARNKQTLNFSTFNYGHTQSDATTFGTYKHFGGDLMYPVIQVIQAARKVVMIPAHGDWLCTLAWITAFSSMKSLKSDIMMGNLLGFGSRANTYDRQ